MVKGLYTAYTGMVQQQKRMEVVTNNLANSDTNGFKKEGATSVSFADVYAAKIKDESEFFNNRRIGTMIWVPRLVRHILILMKDLLKLLIMIMILL